MAAMHRYRANVQWTGNLGEGTAHYRAYERNYTFSILQKTDLPGSSDPGFRGDPTLHNPEDLLVASLSACHMLWYPHLCTEAKVVTSYHNAATGLMEEWVVGGGSFKEVVLNPTVSVSEQWMVDTAMELHQKANVLCSIANSVKFPVKHHAKVVLGNHQVP